MISEREQFFKVTPINPFTVAQAEILELRMNGYSVKEIAAIRGTSPRTVGNVIKGTAGQEAIEEGSAYEIGVYGVIQQLSGKRPCNILEAANMLDGDVVLRVNKTSR